MVRYTVQHMKTEWIKKRASRADLDALQSVATTLGLDASATLWFLVREKQRELGLTPSPAQRAPAAAPRL
jgi:hypothetical protein